MFFQQASLASKMSAQVRLMSAIMAEARVHYSQQSNFITLSNSSPTALIFGDYLAGEPFDAMLVASGAVPASAIAGTAGPITGSQLQNAWGGEMAVRAGRDGFNDHVGVQFLMYNVPTAACVRLGPSTSQGNAIWTDLITAVAMFGSRATPSNGTDILIGGQGYTLDIVGNFCGLAASSGVVVMGLRARLF